MPVRAWSLVALLGLCLHAHAHTPHHVIDGLELSPEYETDSTVFVLVHNYLLRSNDRAASWQQLGNGIDTPHILTDIAISRAIGTDKVLFVSSDGGGIYTSANGGESWSRFGDGLPHGNIGKLFMAATENEQLVLAAGSARGLFASSIDSADWRRVISDDVQITAIAPVGDDATGSVLAGDSIGGIWKSDSGLNEWRRIVQLDDVGAVTALAEGPNGALLVGTEKSGILELAEDGGTFERLTDSWPDIVEDCRGGERGAPVADVHIRDIESFNNGATILVTTWNRAVHMSRNGGKSWDTSRNFLRCNDQADASGFGTPQFRDLEVGGSSGQDWFLASFEGLFRSDDQGASWVALETMPIGLIRGMGISPAPGDQHALIVTTYGGGAYITSDQGETWTIANHGLLTPRLADAEFTPRPAGDFPVFALARQQLLSRDKIEDGWTARSLAYKGWRRSAASFLEKYLWVSRDKAGGLFLDESERRNAWPMQIELSPSFHDDQTILLGFRRQGVWISTDAGDEWDRSWDGPRDYVTDLKISPDFSNDGTAFAAIRGSGLFVTRDRAGSWQKANKGFDFLEGSKRTVSPNHVVDPPLSRALTDAVLAISPQYSVDRTVYAGSASGLFKSVDGGRSWVERMQGSIIRLAVSPAYGSDKMLLASVRGKGLFRSLDAAKTFESTGGDLLEGNAELTYIEFSPTFATDGIVYGASERDLYISRDSGATWNVIARPVRYEDRRGSDEGPLWFSGAWLTETGTGFSASTQTVSNQAGDSAVLYFVGNTLSWHGERGPSGGMARVVIDGVEAGVVDLYSESVSASTSVFRSSELQGKSHKVVIEVLDQTNPGSAGQRVTVDSIDVSHR